MSKTVIKIDNLYKEYKLGVISHGTLYRDMQTWWAKVCGKEDPNSLISTHHNERSKQESFLALNNISFEVKQGEILGIIGGNGAGKSTLLKILSRITSPTRGEIKIKGRIGSLLEVGTGFHPELTGRENIFLNGAILGMKKNEIKSKIDEIIDFAGINRHIDTPVKRYSSGMSVRLAFSVAAHLDPEILIVDEVLAVGDVDFQKKCLGKMKEISEGQGRTVLFVSHNMSSIKQLCNSGLLLEKGKIIKQDEIDNVVSKYLFYKKSHSFSYWKNQNNEFTNNYFHINEICLEDINGKRAEIFFERGEKIFLCLNVTIKKKHPLFTVGFALYSDETRIYSTIFTDSYNGDVLNEGNYIFKAEILTKLLYYKSYRIVILGGLLNNNFFIRPNSGFPELSFSVIKEKGNSNWLDSRKGVQPGIITPLINWDIGSL